MVRVHKTCKAHKAPIRFLWKCKAAEVHCKTSKIINVVIT